MHNRQPGNTRGSGVTVCTITDDNPRFSSLFHLQGHRAFPPDRLAFRRPSRLASTAKAGAFTSLPARRSIPFERQRRTP